MALRRLRKQITYAALYGILWLLVIGGPIVFLSRPAPPRPAPSIAPAATPAPINIQSVEVIHHADAVDVVARLHNPNAREGIAHYPVTFILFDAADVEIARVPVNSHILPGGIQYISALNIPVARPASRVVLDTPPEPDYTNLSSTITLPSFSTSLLDRAERFIGGQKIIEQKGLVTNTSTLSWQHVEVTALAFSQAGQAIGVGTTFVGRLTAGEQREFTIQWPASPTPIARVVTHATTNIFKEDNIIRAVGDPALLR